MRATRTLLLAALLAAPLPTETSAQQQSSLWGPLTAGVHGVGFASVGVTDAARGWVVEAGEPLSRPLRLLVWYPARPESGEALTFSDYLDPPVEGDPLPPAYLRWVAARDLDVARRQFSPASDSLRDVLGSFRVAGRAGADPAEGRHPLVLHSLGRNDFQQESVPLWELLASHGFVVVVVPQFGPSPADPTLEFTLADQLLQVQDLAAAVRWAHGRPWIDATGVAVVGHSSGGVAGLLYAARNPAVDLVVGLDGSFSTEDGWELLRGAPWDPGSVAARVVDVHAAGKGDRDPRILEWLDGGVCSVGLGGTAPPTLATHFDFQGWPVYTSVVGASDPRAGGARPAELGADFYWGSAWITRYFLERGPGSGTPSGGPLPPFLDAGLVEFEGDCPEA